MFDGGALLVDIGEVFGTTRNIAGIKAAVRSGSDITGAAVGIGTGVVASGEIVTFAVVEIKRAKEFEPCSAVFALGGTDELKRPA